uniref:ShKT domain-containing protein n=1 Tax=Lepeophtheirus salmonis TaxID=72036 RepID=A0A0K2T8F3_LEPSM
MLCTNESPECRDIDITACGLTEWKKKCKRRCGECECKDSYVFCGNRTNECKKSLFSSYCGQTCQHCEKHCYDFFGFDVCFKMKKLNYHPCLPGNNGCRFYCGEC